MTSIQHKIWLLCGIVLCAMGIIWGLLVYYNQLVLEQYNGILQRYLRMNEASERSQRAVAALNEYMLAPDDEKRRSLDRAVRELRDARAGMAGLLNEENAFLLANHMNLMDSLDDAIRRTVMLSGMDNGEQAAAFFGQAARYAGYISETTLSLIGHELSAYDTFYRGIMEQSREIRKLGFLVLGLVLMVLLAFAWWLSRGITRPIQKLTAAARELSRGRFDRPVEIESNDEIAFLARTFDRMRISINDLFLEIRKKAQLEAELAESRLLLRESQLRSLQSQINPHFLFNTLDTLAKKAFLEGAEETSDLIASVASLMRYNLRRLDRAVTLQEEAEMVAQYVAIHPHENDVRVRAVQHAGRRRRPRAGGPPQRGHDERRQHVRAGRHRGLRHRRHEPGGRNGHDRRRPRRCPGDGQPGQRHEPDEHGKFLAVHRQGRHSGPGGVSGHRQPQPEEEGGLKADGPSRERQMPARETASADTRKTAGIRSRCRDGEHCGIVLGSCQSSGQAKQRSDAASSKRRGSAACNRKW